MRGLGTGFSGTCAWTTSAPEAVRSIEGWSPRGSTSISSAKSNRKVPSASIISGMFGCERLDGIEFGAGLFVSGTPDDELATSKAATKAWRQGTCFSEGFEVFNVCFSNEDSCGGSAW